METCRVCGEKFKPRRGKTNKYCAMACYRIAQKRGDYNRTRQKPKTCHHCGSDFYSTGNSKYCDRSCYLAEHTRKVEWECAGCGETQVTSPYWAEKRKYCSHECRVEDRRPDPITCRVCGVLFTPIQIRDSGSIVFKGDRTICSDECFSEWARTDEERKRKISKAFRGENHPNWKGGRSYLGRNFRGPGWRKLAERVRKRDGYECQECGAIREENGRKLSVHHIEPFHNFESIKKANRMSNLTTLCRPCHRRAEWEVTAVQMPLPLPLTA